jgi:hypothetical protein
VAAQVRVATTSVVVVGQFNPAILHPYWFGSRELLPPEQAADAQTSIQALMNEVMAFEAGWLTFQALPQRLTFTSKESASHLELRDLAMATLALLSEVPVTSFGLNRDAHYRVDTEQAWHAIGDRFVPNEPWVELTGGTRAGLQRLVVQIARGGVEHSAEAVARGATNVQIGVSVEAQVLPYGVYVGINDHFQVGTDEEPSSAVEVAEALEREWEPARKRANLMAAHIIR